MKAEKKRTAKVNLRGAGGLACLPLLLGGLLSLTACGEKTEVPTVAAATTTQESHPELKVDELAKKADTGDAVAQVDLAERYALGDGVTQDFAKAADLFQKAAAKGIARAQYRLSQMYRKGEGVPQDSAKAIDLLQQSAANGYAKAQAALSALYAKGEGVSRDEVLAYAWSTLALRQGEDEAKQVHDSVKLTALLQDEAERLVSSWRRGIALVHPGAAGTDGKASLSGTAAQ